MFLLFQTIQYVKKYMNLKLPLLFLLSMHIVGYNSRPAPYRLVEKSYFRGIPQLYSHLHIPLMLIC